jgi:hypothetical protein
MAVQLYSFTHVAAIRVRLQASRCLWLLRDLESYWILAGAFLRTRDEG